MRRSTARTARRLAWATFLVFVLTGGGRIVGSDEVTMLQVSEALLAGRVAVPEGATLPGRDGRFYSKNAAGQAVLALPLVAISAAGARLAGLDPDRRRLAVRFGASFFNAVVTALLIGVFYYVVRLLGAGGGAALVAALMLAFTTPLWVYSKSFMAEPLQALGLTLALAGASLSASPDHRRAGWVAGAGVFLAVSAKLSMLPLAAACLAPLLASPPARWRAPLAGLALALAGHAIYNVARFGSLLETGYGVQATPAAFDTPLLVGLYGLLFSSGKGLAWFAPALWLAPLGWESMRRAAGRAAGRLPERLGLSAPAGRAAWGTLLAWIVGLALYARFQHWAGDGSYGPRYLIPLLPLGFLAVAFALSPRPAAAAGGTGVAAARPQPASRRRRAAAVALATCGLLVQLGGVAIYFGAEMREVGDYPYRLSLEDPRFMSESHFNPHFSPIAVHWRMLERNLGEHLRGEAPRLGAPGAKDARLGLSSRDQRQLLHALDFWWLYLGYSGWPRAPVWGAVLALLALGGWAWAILAGAFRAEMRAT